MRVGARVTVWYAYGHFIEVGMLGLIPWFYLLLIVLFWAF